MEKMKPKNPKKVAGLFPGFSVGDLMRDKTAEERRRVLQAIEAAGSPEEKAKAAREALKKSQAGKKSGK